MSREEARPYAKALFQVAKNKGHLEELSHQMEELIQYLQGFPQLRDYLGDPRIPRPEKEQLFQELGLPLAPEIQRLISLLITRGRTKLLPLLAAIYQEEVEAHLDIIRARFTSAIPLSRAQQRNLRTNLEQLTGKKVRAELLVDPGVIGGVKVEYRDRVIDGTIAGKLAAMEEVLTAPADIQLGREAHGLQAGRN